MFRQETLNKMLKEDRLEINDHTNEFHYCGQIQVEHIKQIKMRGYDAIINVRPDDEEPLQERSRVLAGVCEKQAVHYYYLPIEKGRIPDHYLMEFKKILAEHERVLAFCKTGKRARLLFDEYQHLQ